MIKFNNMRKIILIISFSIMFSLCSMSDEVIEVWENIDSFTQINVDSVYKNENDDSYSFLLKSYNKGQFEPVDGKLIDYMLIRYSLKCSDKSYKMGTFDAYDKENNFLNGYYNKYSNYQPIVEDTAIEKISKSLCLI